MSVLVHGFLFIFSYAQVQEFLMAIPGSVFLSYRSYLSPTLLTMCQTACQNGYFILPLAMDKSHFPHIPSNTWYHQTLFFQQSNGWKWDFPSTWISLTITETEHLSWLCGYPIIWTSIWSLFFPYAGHPRGTFSSGEFSWFILI